jgi:hypothetical protein
MLDIMRNRILVFVILIICVIIYHNIKLFAKSVISKPDKTDSPPSQTLLCVADIIESIPDIIMELTKISNGWVEVYGDKYFPLIINNQIVMQNMTECPRILNKVRKCEDISDAYFVIIEPHKILLNHIEENKIKIVIMLVGYEDIVKKYKVITKDHPYIENNQSDTKHICLIVEINKSKII